MGSLVTCGTIDKNIIFPIIPAIDLFLFQLALKNGIIDPNPIKFVCYSISKCLCFIPFLILKKRSKTNYKKDFSDKLVKQYKKARCQRFYFILISTILDYIKTILSLFYTELETNHWTFDIVVINLVSFLLLKTKLYKHHYFCLAIIFIFGVIGNINDFIEKIDFIIIIINHIKELLLCIGLCIDKYIMDTKYTSPYELCFYSGIFSLCLNFVTLGIFGLFYKEYLEQCREYFAQINNSIQLLFFFLFLIGLFSFILCNCFSDKIYSPNYIINIFIFQRIYHSFFRSQNILQICYNILRGILFIFLFLIFNEIIEINCFGLQKNTKKNIKKRAIMEEEENNETNDDDDKDDNKSDNDDNDGNEDYNANQYPNSQIEKDTFNIELENVKKIGDDIENDM